jgi:amidohydrolase
MLEFDLNRLKSLRKELHKFAELSGNERQTPGLIKDYIQRFKPDSVVEDLGGNGIAFVFNGRERGPSVIFRCELDALPINEINTFAHRSLKFGVSHKCGHDGHMAILAGLAERVSKDPPAVGKVITLFQPSEENGEGAEKVINDPRFKQLQPDFVFALHNLPGFPLHRIIIKDGIFSSASIGLIIRLKGKTSHASEPEKGVNPGFAMARIISELKGYSLPGINQEGIKIITPIHARLGTKAFGTNPGYAEMMFTLRATVQEDFVELKRFVLDTIEKIIAKDASDMKLFMEHEWVEEFPVTVNDEPCNRIIQNASSELQLEYEKISFPFRWSEDFGHFLSRYDGALFGIGAGKDYPALHNPDYDFPDELIQTGVSMFYRIYTSILK